MKVVTVVGARPQFVKAAAVSRALIKQGLKKKLFILVNILMRTCRKFFSGKWRFPSRIIIWELIACLTEP